MNPAKTLVAEQARTQRESLEMEMLLQLRAARLDDGMVRQWMPFAPSRRFAYDFAWPERPMAVALEIEGGIWSRGAHARPAGITRDIEKANMAALAGITLLRATAEHVRSGQALAWVECALR